MLLGYAGGIKFEDGRKIGVKKPDCYDHNDITVRHLN